MSGKFNKKLKIITVAGIVVVLIAGAVAYNIYTAKQAENKNKANVTLNQIEMEKNTNASEQQNSDRVQATVEVQLTDCAVAVGTSIKVTAIVTPANTDQALVWSSSNAGIFEVSNDGILTIKGVGTAVLTATVGNVSDAVVIEGIGQVSDGSANNLPVYVVSSGSSGSSSNSGHAGGSLSNGGLSNGNSSNGISSNGGSLNGGSLNGGLSNGSSSNAGSSVGNSQNGGANSSVTNDGTNSSGSNAGTNGGTSNGGSSAGTNGGTNNSGSAGIGSGNTGNNSAGSNSGGASPGGNASNGGSSGGSSSSGGVSGGNSSGGSVSGGSSSDSSSDKGSDSTQIGGQLPDLGFSQEMSNVYVCTENGTYYGEIITQPNVTIIYIKKRSDTFDDKIKSVIASLLPNEYMQVWNNYVTANTDRTFTVEDRMVRIVVASNGGHSQIVIYN